jgi:hypothetical protein
MIVEILGIIVVIFSIYQIFQFYNLKFSSFGIYISFYVFLAICSFLYPDSLHESFIKKINGVAEVINVNSGTVSATSNVVKYDNGENSFTMETIDEPMKNVQLETSRKSNGFVEFNHNGRDRSGTQDDIYDSDDYDSDDFDSSRQYGRDSGNQSSKINSEKDSKKDSEKNSISSISLLSFLP